MTDKKDEAKLLELLGDFDDDLDDYEPSEEEKEEFKEFFCRECGCELDGDNAPEDGYTCYDCLASGAEDAIEDDSFCAGCGCVLSDDNAPTMGNLCYECENPSDGDVY